MANQSDQFKSEAEKAKSSGNPALAEMECIRYQQLRSRRSSIFDPAWQTLSQYNIPQLSDINTEKVEGTTGWGDRIFDTTAIEAVRTCATGHSNWATPMTEPWFAFHHAVNIAVGAAATEIVGGFNAGLAACKRG